jgi:hypothetical protein
MPYVLAYNACLRVTEDEHVPDMLYDQDGSCGARAMTLKRKRSYEAMRYAKPNFFSLLLAFSF